MDEETQYQDTVSPVGETQTDVTNDQVVGHTEEDYAKLKAENAKLNAIAERKAKQLEKVQSSLKEEDEKPKPPKVSNLSEIEELSFKVDHPELKPQFDLIKTLARGKGISLAEAANDELVKQVLANQKSEAGVSVINSNNKITSSASELTKSKEAVIKSGSVDALASYLKQTGVGGEN
jgi:hypothetical protein